ncbi:hypothetical protein Aduo_000022 [Ancylostoma duodenale]
MPTAAPQVRERIDTLEIFNIFRRRDEDTILRGRPDLSDLPSFSATSAGFQFHRTATTVEAQINIRIASFEGPSLRRERIPGQHPPGARSFFHENTILLPMTSVILRRSARSLFFGEPRSSTAIDCGRHTIVGIYHAVKAEMDDARVARSSRRSKYVLSGPPLQAAVRWSKDATTPLWLPGLIRRNLEVEGAQGSASTGTSYHVISKGVSARKHQVDLFFLCDVVRKSDSLWNTFNPLPSFRRTNSLYWFFEWFARTPFLAVYTTFVVPEGYPYHSQYHSSGGTLPPVPKNTIFLLVAGLERPGVFTGDCGQ